MYQGTKQFQFSRGGCDSCGLAAAAQWSPMSTNMEGRVGPNAAFPIFETISSKFNINLTRKASSHQLLTIVDDVLLCWSPEDGCLLSQTLDVPTSTVQVGMAWQESQA